MNNWKSKLDQYVTFMTLKQCEDYVVNLIVSLYIFQRRIEFIRTKASTKDFEDANDSKLHKSESN